MDRGGVGLPGHAVGEQQPTAQAEQIRTQLEQYREESPGGQFLLTTAASARDYASSGNRQGLKLIRRVPLIEARDALKSEATR